MFEQEFAPGYLSIMTDLRHIALLGSRKIVHLDMDAFYASVEQRDDPALFGRPVVVAWKGKRSVVCAASYEARRFGVRSAMPAVTAERLCPEAVFVAPDFVRYKAVSEAIRKIFERHTDAIEPLSLDEAYLDVTENKTGLPTATLVAKTIRQEIWNELKLRASAGIAPNKFLAKTASDWRKPNGQFVIQPHEAQEFLMTLPIGRIPGVGKVTEARMAKSGPKTVGDLYTMEISTQWRSLHLRAISEVTDSGSTSWLAESTIARSFAIAHANRFQRKTRFRRTSCSETATPTSVDWPRRSGQPQRATHARRELLSSS